MTRRELLRAMALIATYWPHWRIPTDPQEASVMVDAWERLLLDLDSDAVVAAVEAYATTGAEFAPGPGVIRRRAIELSSVSTVPDADVAWAEVLAQVSKVGYCGTPTWSHPAIGAAMAFLGWTEFCASENEMADRAHFLKVYGGIKDRETFVATAPISVRELIARVASERELSTGGDDDGPHHVLDVGDHR